MVKWFQGFWFLVGAALGQKGFRFQGFRFQVRVAFGQKGFRFEKIFVLALCTSAKRDFPKVSNFREVQQRMQKKGRILYGYKSKMEVRFPLIYHPGKYFQQSPKPHTLISLSKG